MKLHIYVPTRGRISEHDQKTMRFLRLEKVSRIHRVVFIVPRCEAREFKRAYPWARVRVVDNDWRIGTITQFMIEQEGQYKVLIDDDFSLLRRRDRCSISQKGATATDEDALDLFKRIRYWLKKGYIHGGISLRQTNHFCRDAWYKNNTRVSGFMFFDSDIIKQEGVRFDDVEERQDFHMTLSLLELGYSNVVDYEFTVGQYLVGTNSPGGCSRYRTPEFLLYQANLLAELHPSTVKVVFKPLPNMKEAKAMASSQGVPDVRIRWAASFGIRQAERKASHVVVD